VVTTTTVEVEADVVVVSVVEVADGSVVVDNTDVVNADVELSVVILDEIISVVEDVESVDTVEDVVATDDVEEDTSVVAVDVDSVVVGAEVVDVTVRVELSIGKTVTALAAAILEATPITAKKRIRTNATRTGTDFIQLSLLFTNGCQDWNGTLPYAGCLRV
jgi:hypothetical protein